MNTLLNLLTVLAVAALLAGPALHGLLREHRIDRELRAARHGQGRPGRARPEHARHAPERPRPGTRSTGSLSPWAGALSQRRTEGT